MYSDSVSAVHICAHIQNVYFHFTAYLDTLCMRTQEIGQLACIIEFCLWIWSDGMAKLAGWLVGLHSVCCLYTLNCYLWCVSCGRAFVYKHTYKRARSYAFVCVCVCVSQSKYFFSLSLVFTLRTGTRSKYELRNARHEKKKNHSMRHTHRRGRERERHTHEPN